MMRSKNLFFHLVIVAMITVSTAQTSYAGFVNTEQALLLERRAQLMSEIEVQLATEQVAVALSMHGVDPQEIGVRLAALTDAELLELSEHLDDLPAGAGAIEVVGVVFIVLLILELVGVTDVFKAI